jgi:hypothetical protein
MKMAFVWLACAAALAYPASAMSEPRSDHAAAQASAKPTLQQQLMAFLFGAQAEAGQPSEECGEEDALNRPGHAENARGSAFNPDGVAGEHYAGEQPQNSKNPKSVSQYDVACAHAQSPQ